MKKLKFMVLVVVLSVSNSVFATGSKQGPPVQPTLAEYLIDLLSLEKAHEKAD